ncbi:MAG: ribbon-helix-helix protein, CopG family [Natronomonas sp.]
MNERTIDLETVTVTFDEETIEALDEKAFVDHRDNREAAIRDCLDEWLKQQADDETD